MVDCAGVDGAGVVDCDATLDSGVDAINAADTKGMEKQRLAASETAQDGIRRR